MALARTAQEHGAPLRIVETVAAVNDARKSTIGRKVLAALGGDAHGKTVALLGLAFKPNTDDMRDAPSLAIARYLLDRGAAVRAYDPEAMGEARKLLPELVFCADAYDCVAGADAAVIVTEWEQFRALDMSRLKAAMRRPALVDLRNVYRPADMKALGFDYEGVGKGG